MILKAFSNLADSMVPSSHHKVSQVLVKQLPNCLFSMGLFWAVQEMLCKPLSHPCCRTRVLKQYHFMCQHVSWSHKLQIRSFPVATLSTCCSSKPSKAFWSIQPTLTSHESFQYLSRRPASSKDMGGSAHLTGIGYQLRILCPQPGEAHYSHCHSLPFTATQALMTERLLRAMQTSSPPSTYQNPRDSGPR